MSQLIQVPGGGTVTFPDDATDEQIAQSLTRDRRQQDIQAELTASRGTPASATALGAVGSVGDAIQWGFKKLDKGVRSVGAFTGDVAEGWSNADQSGVVGTPDEIGGFRNLKAWWNDQPQPIWNDVAAPEVQNDFKASVLSTVSHTAGDLLPRLYLMRGMGAAGVSVPAAGAVAFGATPEGFSGKSAALGAAIPKVQELGKVVGGFLLGKAGGAALAPAAQKAIEEAAGLAAIQTFNMAVESPELVKLYKEEPQQFWHKLAADTVVNTAFFSLSVPELAKGGPSQTMRFSEPPVIKPTAAPYQRTPMDWGSAARPTDAPVDVNPQASDPPPSDRVPFTPVVLPMPNAPANTDPRAPIGDQGTLAVLRALGNSQPIPAELVTPGLQSVIEPAGYRLVGNVWQPRAIGAASEPTVTPALNPNSPVPPAPAAPAGAPASVDLSKGGVYVTPSAEAGAPAQQPAPVPESVATLNAQLQLVQQGTKPAMLVTPGAPMPEVPKGLAVLDAGEPGKIIFDPQHVEPNAVAAAVVNDQIGSLLGYGNDVKPAAGGAVLQTRNADGTPVQEELVTPDTLPSAISASKQTVPDGTMELVPPAQVIAERRDAPSTAQFDPGQVPVVEVPLKKISLSKDVPNFKTDADPETGIVRGQALAGKYERRGTAPVVLWERTNGKLEIITGRHRRELAQRMGEKTIPAQIVREAEGFTKDMALTFDAEANIRDGQGAIEDYAHYFRNSPQLTAQEAGARGLLSRVKGKDGWSLGRAASDDLYALWADDKINTERAVAIARTAPNDAGLQALGVKQALKGKSPADIENFIRVVQAQAGAQSADQMDMFGRNDSAIRQAEEMASRASGFQNEIADQIRAVQSAAKRPEAARKLGVNVADPVSVLAKVMELKGELNRWSNWPTQPDLVARVRGEAAPVPEPSRQPDAAPKVATSKAEISRLDKQINELLDRKAGNDPLSLDEEHLLRSLEARRGQIDLLNVSAEATGQIRQLREKLALVEDQRVKTQARAWKSDVRERAEQLQREASQYQMEAERIREQIRQLEAGPKAPSQGGDFFASPEFGADFKPARTTVAEALRNNARNRPPDFTPQYEGQRVGNGWDAMRGMSNNAVHALDNGKIMEGDLPAWVADALGIPSRAVTQKAVRSANVAAQNLFPEYHHVGRGAENFYDPEMLNTQPKFWQALAGELKAESHKALARQKAVEALQQFRNGLIESGDLGTWSSSKDNAQKSDALLALEPKWRQLVTSGEIDFRTGAIEDYNERLPQWQREIAFESSHSKPGSKKESVHLERLAAIQQKVASHPANRFMEKANAGVAPGAAGIKTQLESQQADKGGVAALQPEGASALTEASQSRTGGTVKSPPILGPGGEPQATRARPRPADNRNFSVIDQSPMEMPEAVQWIRALTGVWPKVRERLGNAAGLFRFTQGPEGKGRVEMKAATFDLLTANEKAALREEAIAYATREAGPHDNVANIAKERYDYLLAKAYEEAKTKNPVAALKTIWHEIGHVVDWLPDHVIRGRGNVLGRLASLHKFLKSVLPLDPNKPAGERITPADKAKLTRDAEAQLREEMGPIQEIVRKIVIEEPEFRIIGITPNDITNILRESAGKETPELTRWFAEQDSKVKAEVLKKAMRGLVDERLAALGKKEQVGTRRIEKTVREKVGREPSTAEIKARFAELLKAEIKARNLAQLETIKAELGPLIAWWRGTATIPDYFKSAHEMYADAFSVFANNPAAVRERAPTYYEMIHNYMDRKPDVMRLYDQTQQDIRTGLVMPVRVANLLTMWSNDDARSLTNMKSRWQTNGRDFYDNVVYHFDRRFGPVYRTAKGTTREGAVKEAVGNYLYRATEHERFLAALNTEVGGKLVEHNLDWTHDLGEYLFHKRVIEERYNLANPLGWTSKNSMERLGEMQQLLGPGRWAALEESAAKWHELYNQFVRDPVVAAKMFSPELNQILLDRAHYATFAAVKDTPDTGIERIIEGQFGSSVGAHIYKQIGNLGEIKNPATATVLKGLSLISAAYRNEMKSETVKMLQELDPENIGVAKTRWNGKTHEPVIVDGNKVGTIVVMRDGKPEAFYVRKVVADAVNQGNPTENVIMNTLVKVTGWQKGLFTQLNYAFWPVNMVRDTAGFLMQMPGFTPAKYLKNLPVAIKAARDSVTHARPNPIADAALKRKLLISQADPRGVYSSAENEYELKLLSHGMNPAAWNVEAGKVHALIKAWNYYRELGQTIERVNKISGMLYLDEKYPNLPEWKKREIIRERSGSPNFLERGASNPAVDLVFLFYNPWKEGVRSLAHSARENPYSFAAKATVAIALPTILQAAAVNGLLGDERKKQYRSIPDYDLTNYLCIPLGWQDEQHTKIAYLRLPLWEPARIAHGTLFQTLTDRGQGILSHAGGQVPGLNPIWTTGLQWAEYMQGRNPVDITRGVNVLTKTQQEARGPNGEILNAEALAQLGKNTWNNLGGSLLMRFKNLNLEAPAETVGEKWLSLPGVNNALGRWVKISDRGIADADRKLTAAVEQGRAITREAMQPVIDKIAKGEGGALTDGEKQLLHDPYAVQYLRERLPEVMQSRMSPDLRRLNNAPSAASKAVIVQDINQRNP